jgi:hypothetical protein
MTRPGKIQSRGEGRGRGWPAQCPGVPSTVKGTRRSFLKPLRRKHLRDPPLERRSLCTPSSQKPRARHEPARTGRGPSPAMCGGVTGQIPRSRGNDLGAALGATGTNDFGFLRTYANSEHGPIPRSRTVLNGSGRPHWNLRIRWLEVRVPPSAPGLTRRDASSRAVRTVPAEPGIARIAHRVAGTVPAALFRHARIPQ